MSEQQQPVHYIHRMEYSVQERLVGVFLLGALAILFVLMFINSKTAHLFEDRIILNTYLTKAEGISTDTPVKISGIEVGKVASLDIAADHRIHLRLIIYQRYQPLVRSDSTAAVSKLSVLGKPVINITAGTTTEAILEDEATIEVEEPLSVDELLAELTPVIQGVESSVKRFAEIMQQIEPQQVGNIITRLDSSARHIEQISARLNSTQGTLGMAINDPAFQQRFSSAVTSIDHAFVQMEQRLQELERLSLNLGESSSEFPALTSEFKTVLNNTNALLTSVNVEMKQLPDLVTRMNVLMEQTDRLLEGINNSWLFSSDEGKLQRKLIGVQPYHE
ncbi:MAG: MlaD family protein [Gammaproteobacteria bacterium]|nr:MlaD family protein [Gammaproteobacteria bacterium]